MRVIPSVQWCNQTLITVLQSPATSPVMCADLLVAPSRHELGGT